MRVEAMRKILLSKSVFLLPRMLHSEHTSEDLAQSKVAIILPSVSRIPAMESNLKPA